MYFVGNRKCFFKKNNEEFYCACKRCFVLLFKQVTRTFCKKNYLLFVDDQVIISGTEDGLEAAACKLNQIITEHV